ncbi:MAG TPA: tetratricopeptide repeat protein, partial [Gemmatimonadales bacterium]|nr:tetratricopeptide repeat protein [Gemmatimonadales bacterium]
MFSTDQFRVFSGSSEDRLLSRPRRLLQEGRMAESESAYQAVLSTNPEIKQTWVEYFALLRHARRHDDALALGHRAAAQFGDDAMPLALRGAALVELGEYRDGLEALDHAARLNPNLGLVWHEAGYAAFRLGELSRALMALDRAFALEPHGGTLHLRGQVLRKAGRYLAAEVAFEGAAEAAEFRAQRDLAEREIAVTRRYGIFPERRPDLLAASHRWFADTGAIPLTSDAIPPASDGEIITALADLCRAAEWRFTTLVALDTDQLWTAL